ncbi:alpha-glucan water dikinase, chloroplastic [Impatiens glandulifera]|uniref:alpha-glucan water dikinase, chloroplastic n=1 Tax=Impatiens glandulifera TaxID=253017 RepID=UPI001FB14222|nr:alpha-glucan water dikinase, chloroplastic [Impatiens glandulifera]XP_047318796.1 alpha-glucan water dikinase, chloroplastic [Impatiens glandulifera]
MSHSISHCLLHQRLLPSTVFEHQSKTNAPCISSRNTLFKPQATSHIRNSHLSTEFRGRGLHARRRKQLMETRRSASKAALATGPASELIDGFKLEGNSELKISVSSAAQGAISQVEIQVTNSNNSLLLHWGGVPKMKEKWVLPARRPEGTQVYKDRALRTPFLKSGPHSILKIEIDDPALQALEFLIFDEEQNKWFKNRGENFIVKLPARDKPVPKLSVPEDLVQIQAYLRWERKGKQSYTAKQEKEEYEAARAELLDEVSKGTSIQDLRTRLTNKNGKSTSQERVRSETKSQIPDDLIQSQAYLRWEKAGKPSYSDDQQLKEFEQARRELQVALDEGSSLDELRKKFVKGEIKTKVVKQPERKSNFSPGRIQRKKRDPVQLLSKKLAGSPEEMTTRELPALSPFEQYGKLKVEQAGDTLLHKKVYKIADKKLLVLVNKANGKLKVHLATDLEDPLILHWALSHKAGEWVAPPPTAVPLGSSTHGNAIETQFKSSSGDLPYKVQSLEIEFEDEQFVGMPFVLLSGEKWIKNNGSDFYAEFSTGSMVVKKVAVGDGQGTATSLLNKIADLESEAQKSFMHRFNIAADLIDEAKGSGELGFAGLLVWMRFMATRQLIWNKNYNVKPREISKAQDRLTDLLQNAYKTHPQCRELVRMIMSSVGRGGEGDVGQRIRDEILVIQRKNDCKGGIMEEWHQKLHNNTSPDDVVICQALIDYIKSDFDISVYWKTLNENGITKERLLSYDRAIHSEPNFRGEQKDGLLQDLGHYMRTLKAVHSGADLESAISNCMGYKTEGQGFMVGVEINPISGLPSEFPELLRFILDHVEDRNVEALLEGLLEARQELRPSLSNSSNRLKDLLFLDIALDSTVRTATERGYEELNNAQPEKIMYFINLVLENLILSSDDNEDFIYCFKGWNHALNMLKSGDSHWALYAKSVLDRTRLALASKAEWYHHLLQPSAEYLGSQLGVDKWAIDIFTEEIIRSGSAASLSALINRLDPVLRETAHLGSWQIISPVEVVGYVVVVDQLLTVQNKSYDKPTILVAKSVKGEEEIPDGTVAVLTPDMPDVLSHVSVRARNCKVCFATCFDPNILADLEAKQGKLIHLKPTSSDIVYSETKEDDLVNGDSSKSIEGSLPSVTLTKKQFLGRYAISSDEFTPEMVGAKSRNIAYLKGKVPSWVGIPTSVALPFGVFEEVLSDNINKVVSEKLQVLKKKLYGGDINVLGEIRKTVLELAAPEKLVTELKLKMQSAGMPWPGDESQERWKQAWTAIKKVWASKWNERAFFSTRKVKLDHEYLCMAVLVQEIINADYAFVIHTTNPSSGDSSEIYAELVKGLGETLVGAYPGRALSFVCKKNNLNSPQVLGYPSKPIGLFISRSIIFRSDSNGEDLEGYAGAGLYDSVPMDEEEKVVIDYSSDKLMVDGNFRESILTSIAKAGNAIEELYGSPQDIEGVVKDGKIYVVQTRPQM